MGGALSVPFIVSWQNLVDFRSTLQINKVHKFSILSIELYKGRLAIPWGLKRPLSKPYDSPYIVPNQQILVWLSFYYRKFQLCFRWENGTDSQFPKESDLICNLPDKCFQTLREQQRQIAGVVNERQNREKNSLNKGFKDNTDEKMNKKIREISSLIRSNLWDNELNLLTLGLPLGLRRGLHMCSKFFEGHGANWKV